jgi:hypothetical protein
MAKLGFIYERSSTNFHEFRYVAATQSALAQVIVGHNPTEGLDAARWLQGDVEVVATALCRRVARKRHR